MNISMASLNNSNNITSSIPSSRKVIFAFLIIFGVPSIICSIFLIHQFIRRPRLRRKPINLLIFCLIMLTFLQKILEMPLTLVFLYQNRVVHQSHWFCQFWNILQSSFGSSIFWITMISSIERYLFVFHSTFLKHHFILLRITPLIWSIFQPLITQTMLIVIVPPCISTFHYDSFMCDFPCYVFSEFWGTLGWNVYIGVPGIVTIISNSILIGRVLKHKRRLQQSNIWPKVVRLIIQVMCVALLDIIAWMPLYVAGGIGISRRKFSPSSIGLWIFMEYLVYLPYLVVTFCPFMCLIGLHELHKPLKELIHNYCHRNQIQAPVSIPTILHRRYDETEQNS